MTDAEKKYRSGSGMIVMCMHCRRTLSNTGEWVAVEDFIRNRPTDVSDGLCDVCLEKHYSQR
jgi:hypothetical protein